MHEMAFQQHMFHVLLLKKISLLREIPSRKIFFLGCLNSKCPFYISTQYGKKTNLTQTGIYEH